MVRVVILDNIKVVVAAMHQSVVMLVIKVVVAVTVRTFRG
jgi:hypothetical protein